MSAGNGDGSKPKNAKFSPQMSAVLEVLLSGGTQEAAAQAAEVHPKTVWRWMQEDFFLDEWEVRQAARNRMANPILHAQIAKSIFRLAEIRDDPETPPAVVVQACNALLNRALPGLPPPPQNWVLDIGGEDDTCNKDLEN